MKTLTKSLMLAAVAATTILSCTKEVETPVENTNNGAHVEFSAKIADATTKATLTTTDDNSFAAAWVDGTDIVSLYAYDGSFDEEAPATWNESKEAFEADFNTSAPTTPGDWMYEAKYPYDADGNIPFGSQRVQNGNAYNSAYDIMYGTVDYTNALLGKDDTGANFVIPMNRLTGIAYFHITSSIDEDVVSATLEATGIAAENVTIASNGASVAPSTGSASLNAITITFADGTAPKATDLQLWFNVLPGSYTGLKLTINTTTKTAVLNSKKTMTYTAGKLNKAVLSSLTWNSLDPFEGEWLLTGIKGEKTYACGNYTTSNNIQNVKEITVDASNHIIEGEDLGDCKIIITKVKSGNYQGYYTIQDSNVSNNYWYAAGTGTSNYLKAAALNDNSDQFYWTIEQSGDNHVITAKSTNRNTIKFNIDGANTIFSCYASDGNQKPVTLYPYSWVSTVTRTPVSLSFDPASPEAITFGDDFTEPTLVKNPADAPVTYSVETIPDGIATIDANTGELSITSDGTITVTATVSDLTAYKPASASYTLTVKEYISDYSIAESSNVTLSAADGTNASTATVNGHSALKAGTSKKSGSVVITVPAKTTNLHLHAVGWDGEEVTLSITGATANPNSLNLTSNAGISGSGSSFTLSDVADYYFNIALSGINAETTLTFSSAKRFVIWGVNAVEDKREDSGMSWSASEASASITNSGISFTAPMLTTGNATNISYQSTVPSVAEINASGNVSIKAEGTTKIQAIFAGNTTYKPSTKEYTLTVTDERTYAIAVTQPEEGGEISANPNGSQKAGTEITLTATPASGYKLSAWNVYKTGEENTKVTVTNNAFEMPAYPVTVTASFAQKTGPYSMTPDTATTGSSATSYITTLTEFTYEGITWKMNQWNPSNLQIKTNQSSAASEFRFYNTSAFSGRISKVVVKFSALTVSDASKLMFKGGTTAVTSTTGGTAGTWDSTTKTLTWTPGASDNFTYFAFYQDGKAASGTNYLANTDAIVVTYE